jgi:iron complex transport system ATP-binding protein
VILQARSVTVRYRPNRPLALNGVDCEVSAGELVAVVGPNGSGKTTLLRALLGLVPLERGEARVDGRPVAEWPRRLLAQTIGVIGQQEESVFPLTVAETVMLGRYAYLGPLSAPGAADRATVHTALARCDILGLADRPVDSLSGGEWKRVRIARALAQEPRALVLDEPTSSLDVRHEMELFELVHQLVKTGLGGLVITHHLNLAARFADRILLLAGGAVVASGPPAQVLTRETVSRVFEWPVAVMNWSDGSPQVVPLRASDPAASVNSSPAHPPRRTEAL